MTGVNTIVEKVRQDTTEGEDGPGKKTMMKRPVRGRRGVGRQRLRWRDSVRGDTRPRF